MSSETEDRIEIPRPKIRVSQACKICGFKKIKCGGEYPRCKTCVLHDRECVYGISKRNTRLNLLRPSIRSPHSKDEEALRQLSIAASRESFVRPAVNVSPGQSAKLFQTYFDCIHTIWPLLYKPLYNHIGNHQLASHLPKAVVYAIYAISACLPSSAEEDNPIGTGSNLPEPARAAGPKPSMYFDAALAELQLGSGSQSHDQRLIHALIPSIPSCQALMILALQQHGLAEYSRSGMLCGLASAMAIDLRLHRNHWAADPVEREVCSRLWWNLYILEKMMSFELGRPVTLRYEESDTPYPSIAESDEFELFTSVFTGRRPNGDTMPAVKVRTLSIFATTIDMCKMMERISRQVYSLGARENIRQDRAAGDVIRMSLWRETQEWRRRIEASELKLDLSKMSITLPAVVTNYVTTECAVILLHRPFISHWQAHTEQTGGTAPFTTPDPAVICYQAAKEICTILEVHSEYLPRLPCDVIFPIFTAASVLLHELRQSLGEHSETRRRLQLCMYWLGVFGKNWKSAGERTKLFNDLAAGQQAGQQSPGGRYPYVGIQENAAMVQSSASAVFQTDSPSINTDVFGDILTSVDDWTFLNNFGDPSDGFYSMDMDFRNILDRQTNDGPM